MAKKRARKPAASKGKPKATPKATPKAKGRGKSSAAAKRAAGRAIPVGTQFVVGEDKEARPGPGMKPIYGGQCTLKNGKWDCPKNEVVGYEYVGVPGPGRGPFTSTKRT